MRAAANCIFSSFIHHHSLPAADNNYDTGSNTTIDRRIGHYYGRYLFPYKGTQPGALGGSANGVNRLWAIAGNQ
jgi:hypothetical protein